jgi:hypothetical protein
MPINFPDSPAENDSFTSGGKKWIFNGSTWNLITANSYTIPTGEVTTDKIATGAVHEVKLASGAVTAAKLASGAAVANIGYTPANTASPTFTGNVVLPSTTSVGAVTGTEISYLAGVSSMVQTQLNAKAPVANPTFTGTVSGITKSMVGLGSVDNTADTAKPVSTAQQTALNLKANLESPTFSGNVTEDFVHGIVHRLRLPAVHNGNSTGEVSFHMWVSEPGATWTGCGISRNRINSAGSFPRPNTGLSAQMIRFDEGGNISFTCTNSAGGENGFLFDTGGSASKPGGGSWSALSDIRLKDNVRDYDKGTAELMQVRVREWEHNGKGGLQAGSKGLGVVANEIELVLPDTVHTYEGKLNPEDEETTDIKSVNATEITWLLVKTVQEQQAVIEQLTARIEALEA